MTEMYLLSGQVLPYKHINIFQKNGDFFISWLSTIEIDIIMKQSNKEYHYQL